MKTHLLCSAIALGVIPSVSSAALVAALDFADNGSAWIINVEDSGVPLTFGLGGDITNVGIENVEGSGGYQLLRQVNAPAGYTMSNIVLTAKASGFSSWVMDGRVGFDVDPELYPLQADYGVRGALPSGQINVDQNITLDASGDEDYTGITSIYVIVEIWKGLPGVWQANNVRNIEINADLTPVPEPASAITLLAVGAGAVMSRRRRV